MEGTIVPFTHTSGVIVELDLANDAVIVASPDKDTVVEALNALSKAAFDEGADVHPENE
jgi:hypothetical protein